MTREQAVAEAQKLANEHREPCLVTFDKWYTDEFAESDETRFGYVMLAMYVHSLAKNTFKTFGVPEEVVYPK